MQLLCWKYKILSHYKPKTFINPVDSSPKVYCEVELLVICSQALVLVPARALFTLRVFFASILQPVHLDRQTVPAIVLPRPPVTLGTFCPVSHYYKWVFNRQPNAVLNTVVPVWKPTLFITELLVPVSGRFCLYCVTSLQGPLCLWRFQLR